MTARAMVLASASIFALAVACGSSASAADGSFRIIEKGEDGKGGGQRSSDRVPDSTPGSRSRDITTTNDRSNLSSPAHATQVEILSQGGKGAGGTIISTMGGSYYTPGKDGGDAGTVVLRQTGAIAGSGGQQAPTSLLTIFSIGGGGAVGATGQNPRYGVIGNGGQGGAVTLDLQSAVGTAGDLFGGVWAKSQGGQTGENDRRAPWQLGVSPDQAGRYPGASGGDVSVAIAPEGSVKTSGSSAPAFVAQSLGGAGLDGGSYRFVLPGAGRAGKVAFENGGTIETQGASSSAVILQSIGGRGGNQIVAATSPGLDYTGAAGGGSGGAGNDGGGVSATQSGTIRTLGEYAFGLAASSMGGRGGDGIVGFQGRSGGDGGAAGNGGLVDVIQAGTISTKGKGAVGLLAQSLGGGNAADAFQKMDIKPTAGGGAAGSSVSAFWPAGSGGIGGAGGNGGQVHVTQAGVIETSGEAATGLQAQSVGGGGGAGGASSTVLSLGLGTAAGGNGGGGGNGGTVTIRPVDPGLAVAPSITTSGKAAGAILAQSIGGGGGSGGGARASSVGVIAAASFAIGGAGGDGGDGGSVTVHNVSRLSTAGDEAYGLAARSVGGGGGQGGNASASTLAAAPPGYPTFSLAYSVGGQGGKGGAGSAVTVDNDARIATGGQRAYGILAQSVGGGGGSSGSGVSTSDLLGIYKNVSVTIGLGGTGGGGGGGGQVRVDNHKPVETAGAFSSGIQAASIGGGGGNGGTGTAKAKKGVSTDNKLLSDLVSDSLPIADVWSAKVAIGGKGGGGGSGGEVEVTNRSTVVTREHDARGILVQSIGGGGGDGGGYVSSGAGDAAGELRLGGSGGGGGNGGKVTVVNLAGAEIATAGVGATAIFAQSVGGGGGLGGAMAGGKKSIALPDGAQAATDAVIQLAEEVFAINKRVTKEFGDSKLAAAEAGFFDKNSTAQGRLKSAKEGLDIVNAGWDAAKQNLARNEKIRKENVERAKRGEAPLPEIGLTAMVVESLYEAAKTGALNAIESRFSEAVKEGVKSLTGKAPDPLKTPTSVSVSVGGSGGHGGQGGEVDVTNGGSIRTGGVNAYAVLAQSVGGGGGVGGGGTSSGSNWYNLALTVGGSGGDGGSGGGVTATHLGTIRTEGGGAFGILAQSIGGGGGVGGGAVNTDAVAAVSRTVNVGGANGVRGDGGQVTVTSGGSIETAGREAHAVVAQSIGGGGGAYSLDRGSPVSADLLVTTQEQLDAVRSADALMVQLGLGAIGTQGGATGRVGNAIIPPFYETVNLGARSRTEGASGTTGAGGAVEVRHAGQITTSGLGAMGIVAQSVGGGGGLGAYAVSGVKREATLGGAGDTRGDGGAVTVRLADRAVITTSGAGASAIFAQSIGGGGGYAGAAQGAASLSSPIEERRYPRPIYTGRGFSIPPAPYTVKHGTSGNGGPVEVRMENAEARLQIVTTGERAHAVFAQSIGGGGGAWFDVDGTYPLSDSKAASRDATMAGKGGAVTIDLSGQIVASGKDSYAIYAQSGVQRTDGSIDPGREGGAIAVTVRGTVSGGSGSGAALRLDGGYRNTIRIEDGSVVGAASGVAILGSQARDTLVNLGTITGNIDLRGGSSDGGDLFDNGVVGAGNAVLRTGPSGLIDLGGNGRFRNYGQIDIGGVGQVGRARIVGAFLQSEGGRLLVDIDAKASDPARRSDHLEVTGAARLAGIVTPNVIGGLLPGDYTFLTAGSIHAMTAQATATTLSSTSIPVTWAIVQTGNSLALQPKADFTSPHGITLTPDQAAVASRLQSAWNSRSRDQAALFEDLYAITSTSSYADALNEVSPESNQYALTSRVLDARAGLKRAMSCPAFEGSGTLLQEGECVWGRITGARTSLFSSHDEGGYRQTAISYQGGLQTEFTPDWFFGLSGAYTRAVQSDADRITGNLSDAGDISAALKHQVGPWLFAASANLGYAWQTNVRSISIANQTSLAHSKSEVLTAGGRLRASYQVLFDDWYIKPYADLDVLHTHSPAYAETGAPGRDLDLRALSKTLVAFSPNVEIGGRVDLDAGRWLRPYGTLGVTLLSDDHFTGFASFRGSNGLGAFAIGSRIPDRLGEAGLGLQIGLGNGIELTGEYQAHIGDRFLSQTGTARMQMRF